MNGCYFVFLLEEDTVAPIIDGCPDDQFAIIELGLASAVVTFVEPTATDVSGTATLVTRSNAPGDSYPVGMTTVLYIFQDPTGNAATCSFLITVTTGNDNQCYLMVFFQMLACKHDISRSEICLNFKLCILVALCE